MEIQSALIRANYLTGDATGEWNAESQQAMQRYQADHHWQTKIIPDSRALISLGLGPTSPAGTASAAAAPAVTPVQASKPAEHSRTGTSSALTLADAHSILN